MKYIHTIFLFIFACNILLFAQPLNNSGVKVIMDTTIFPLGSLGSCHASTIVETTPGTFIAAWFAGSHEGAVNVGIWSSTFRKNEWTKPVELAVGKDSSGKQLPCWNPVLFKTRNNKLILFYKVGINTRQWWGNFICSYDNGKSWTRPKKLPAGFLGPIKDKPIELANGNILCPSSTEGMDGKWTIHLEITNEALSKWEKIEIPMDSTIGVIQPTILKHSDGRLQMLCRSRQNSIYQTWSKDNGLHWSKLEKTNLPNPNSGIDAVTLNNGNFVLVYNPLHHGREWFNGRNILNVAISKDGEHWEDIYQLENHKKGKYSYPAVIEGSDKLIHITYTDDRKSIKYVVLKFN